MAGRVTKSEGQEGRGVVELAERRRRRSQRTGTAAPVGDGPQRPAVPTDPPLDEPPTGTPSPYSLVSALELDHDDPAERSPVTGNADEILDALPTAPLAHDEAEPVEVDEIGVQLHRHHERLHQPVGPRVPRGSADLAAQTPPVRRRRTPRPARASRRPPAAGQRGAIRVRRRGRLLSVVGLVSVAVVAGVIALVKTGSSPHPAANPRLHATATSRTSAAGVGSTAAMANQLLTFWNATATVGERVQHDAQQHAERARRHAATVGKARAREQSNRTAGRRARLRHEKATAAARAASSAPETSSTASTSVPTATTPADSYSAPSTSRETSSASGSGSSGGGSSSATPAGPTGVGSVSGCDPKCS